MNRKRIRGKKIAALLLALCLVLLTACAKDGIETAPGGAQTDASGEATKPGSGKLELPSGTDTKAEAPTALPEKEPEPTPVEPPRVLQLDRSGILQYEWDDDFENLLYYSTGTLITLSEDEADEFPALSEKLNETATMQRSAQDDEADNLSSFAKESLAADPEYFHTLISTLNVEVRRADTVAVSLLSDSFSSYGNIYGRYLHGTTYNTATGEELAVSDVITDMSAIPSLVTEALVSRMDEDSEVTEDAVKNYFKETPADGISWTLDYNGVTFYFQPCELASSVYGPLCATIPFAGYDTLFASAYTAAPEAYIVTMPLDMPLLLDTDGDGTPEGYRVGAGFDEEYLYYYGAGIYTDSESYYEDLYADALTPCYVRTADGDNLIYLFREVYEDGSTSVLLYIYRISDGEITRIGEKEVAPLERGDEVYAVPTDPDELYLEDYSGAEAIDFGEPCTVIGGLPIVGDAVHVSSMQELLEAVEPYAQIVVEPGLYNLTDYIGRLDVGEFNKSHGYVQLRECYDGVEVVVHDVDGLVITGAARYPADTEIVTEPRYASVLNFDNCNFLTLANIKLGHTDTGDCSGSVVELTGSYYIDMFTVDLYGCGVYGISAYDGTEAMYVYNSCIHHCADGPFDIWNCPGCFVFMNCDLSDSDYGGYFDADNGVLCLYECNMGQAETNRWYFEDDIIAIGCTWCEPTEYPDGEWYGDDEDYDYEPPEFDPLNMKVIPTDTAALSDTYWLGYLMTNPQSGESTHLPYYDENENYFSVDLFLYEDGTGYLYFGEEESDITWRVEESYSLVLSDGERNMYGTLYTLPEGDGTVWILLQRDEAVIWLY